MHNRNHHGNGDFGHYTRFTAEYDILQFTAVFKPVVPSSCRLSCR